jgi:hypothetical protein
MPMKAMKSTGRCLNFIWRPHDDGGSNHLWNSVSCYESTRRNITENSHFRNLYLLVKMLLWVLGGREDRPVGNLLEFAVMGLPELPSL